MKPHPLLIAVPMRLGLAIPSHADTIVGIDRFTDVPGKINTTSTTYSGISADPKNFFRLSTP